MTATVPELRTDRLLLRAHVGDDLTDCHAIWAHPDVARFTGGRTSTREQVWWRILRYGGLWQMLGYGYFAVVGRRSGRMIGDVGLADFCRDCSPALGQTPEAGWAFHPDVHGRGLANEALAAVLDWADTTGIGQVCCIIDPGNSASLRLSNKVGFKDAGTVVYHGQTLMRLDRATRIPNPPQTG